MKGMTTDLLTVLPAANKVDPQVTLAACLWLLNSQTRYCVLKYYDVCLMQNLLHIFQH